MSKRKMVMAVSEKEGYPQGEPAASELFANSGRRRERDRITEIIEARIDELEKENSKIEEVWDNKPWLQKHNNSVVIRELENLLERVKEKPDEGDA